MSPSVTWWNDVIAADNFLRDSGLPVHSRVALLAMNIIEQFGEDGALMAPAQLVTVATSMVRRLRKQDRDAFSFLLRTEARDLSRCGDFDEAAMKKVSGSRH